MASDSIPRPAAQFHSRQNNFVTYVNGHLADLGLEAGVMVGEISGWVGDPPPTPPPPGWPRNMAQVQWTL